MCLHAPEARKDNFAFIRKEPPQNTPCFSCSEQVPAGARGAGGLPIGWVWSHILDALLAEWCN